MVKWTSFKYNEIVAKDLKAWDSEYLIVLVNFPIFLFRQFVSQISTQEQI